LCFQKSPWIGYPGASRDGNKKINGEFALKNNSDDSANINANAQKIMVKRNIVFELTDHLAD